MRSSSVPLPASSLSVARSTTLDLNRTDGSMAMPMPPSGSSTMTMFDRYPLPFSDAVTLNLPRERCMELATNLAGLNAPDRNSRPLEPRREKLAVELTESSPAENCATASSTAILSTMRSALFRYRSPTEIGAECTVRSSSPSRSPAPSAPDRDGRALHPSSAFCSIVAAARPEHTPVCALFSHRLRSQSSSTPLLAAHERALNGNRSNGCAIAHTITVTTATTTTTRQGG
mmetsp:Transcript_1302/g.3962  ORF Transcript_1302/g.3962 Transcript_1302/m.3962 type:complete len:231 (+) Transcript_1302:696-1388(+)